MPAVYVNYICCGSGDERGPLRVDALAQRAERVGELLDALALERLDDVVVVDARSGKVVEQRAGFVDTLGQGVGDLAVVRAGIASQAEFLAGKSNQIRTLQTSPGRLAQTLADASRGVAAAGGSGIGGNRNTTVSYYVKGDVVGLLLDARIRKLTDDRRCLDDVMREAYRRYGGERGFKPEEFEAVASEVAGADLGSWLEKAVRTTEELDYSEMLDWFGLRFIEPGSADPARAWSLEPRPDASEAQQQHLRRWLDATAVPVRTGGGFADRQMTVTAF